MLRSEMNPEQLAQFNAEILKRLDVPGYPIIVSELRPVGDKGETISVTLEQLSDKSISTQSSLLSFTMDGHSGFGSSKTKRVAFQNFSKGAIEKHGIKVGEPLQLKGGDGLVIESKIVIFETQEPKTWVNAQGLTMSQPAKTAGKDGGRLLYQGKPIYRNYVLAIKGMKMEDTLIPHDSIEQASPVSATHPATTVAGTDVNLFM